MVTASEGTDVRDQSGAPEGAPAAPIPVIEGIFRTEDDRVTLVGSRCPKCGTAAFPPRRSCLACGSREVETADLGSRATVYSFARADMAMPGYEPGHLFGMVELDSGPRIYAHFEGTDYDSLKIGAPVELVAGVIRTDEEGRQVLGPKFRPADDAPGSAK